MANKRILVLGATGAMAVYLIPELLKKGYEVVGVSLEDVTSDNENLTYIKANAFEMDFLKSQCEQKYDAIVDFMIYNSVKLFESYHKLFLDNTEHYIFFSTYRVYAGETPITEDSLRILDMERPDDFVTRAEYSIYKAEEEDFLRGLPNKNYTIVRPAITYSKRRFQLTTLEANVLVYRMLNGKTVVLPEGAMKKQATMSWAGDVAKMLSALILNPEAYGETYTVSTAEHMTWEEVAKIYEEIGGLKYITVDNETYLDIISKDNVYAKQQLYYDRCYDRIVDNSKILAISGLKQDELMPLKDGLKRELENVTLEMVGCYAEANARMDEYLKSIGRE